MDAGFLNDLLECSVCLEQLDGTSKVLPCQHTFCKQCLEEIVHMHKELRCPECRVLVETRIDELPSNILLIRLLEGIKNNSRFARASEEECSETVTLAHKVETSCSLQSTNVSRTVDGEERRPLSKQIVQPSLCAKALHSHEAKEPGDLSFKKGDIIFLRKRIDQNWYRGELNGKTGLLPANYVQIVVPAPPQCKALYDFRVNSTDEKDCLTFSKGDLITVIRRVDENWAEGKLCDKIGIFPISFVEMNSAGRTVMKLSSNASAGPSRVAPPTPISEDSHIKQPKLAISSPVAQPCSDLTSTPSSPSNPSTPCSSSSPLSPPLTMQVSEPSVSSPLPTSSHSGPIPHVRNANRHHSEKRNSLCAPSQRSPKPSGPHRHSMEILNSTTDDEALLLPSQSPPVTIPPPLPQQWVDSSGGKLSQRHSSGSRKEEKGGVDCPLSPSPNHIPLVTANHSSSTHAVVPIFYVALFNYKPQKEDELELRKNELYTVCEKCQDGWFKGTSLRCGKSGVFPGNYVQVAKSTMLSAQFQPTTSSVANIRPASGKVVPTGLTTAGFGSSSPLSQPKVVKPVSFESNNRHVASDVHPKVQINRTSISEELLEWARSVATMAPQKLQQQVPMVATPQHAYKTQVPLTASQHTAVVGVWPNKTPEATMTSSYPATPTTAGSPTNNFKDAANGAQSWHGTLFSNCVLSAASAVTPPNVSVGTSGNTSRMDRKERKEQREKISLMKRLTSKRKSRSPPLVNYSCDNPSFVDTPLTSCSTTPLPAIHVRSGSCPNEALGNNAINHKKTSSLDGSSVEIPKSSYRPKQPVPLVRERFRCIVPYPPNSEYELELKVGDVVYVQKKREDGWYKGTQQRTGKTGLFPASFVESF